ncbi:cytochrome P450 [Streptomyces noursei]|uniref:cytochrome P450 n=1 Tax=Streptomyces noursei TaxID=1971 RepID=UPI0016794300|nr:cytochrome P450 [Streptomyces noursei]MCZ1019872.1 cytochrome P450 [Streptomyces noursei]GGX33957.1 cytochrome P450 [Streptomyces noursei]
MPSTVGIPRARGAWPLIGHAPSLARAPLRFIRTLASYGDIVEVRLGRMPAYVLTHPDLVHQVLVTDAQNYTRGYVHDKGKTFLGEGLVTSSGPVHRRHRRMLQPEFHRARLAEHAKVMQTAVAELTSRWRPGQLLALDQEMASLALTTVTRCLFAGLPETAAAATQRAVPVLMKGSVVRGVTPQWVGRLPLPMNRRFDKAVSDVSAVVDSMIAANRARDQDRGDMLSTLLHARDADGKPLTDQEIHDQVVTFYMAGVETTSAALAWTFHELARHPDAERRLHSELDTALRGRMPTYDDLPQLPYTTAVINEILRRYAIWFQMRRTRRPVRLGDAALPAGAELIYSPHLLHHDPRWFPDPDRFDPGRWTADRAQHIPKRAFIPFAAGVHKCMGDTFAVTQLSLHVATICTRWRLRPAQGREIRQVIHATVHPDKLPMIAESKSP